MTMLSSTRAMLVRRTSGGCVEGGCARRRPVCVVLILNRAAAPQDDLLGPTWRTVLGHRGDVTEGVAEEAVS